MAGQGRGGSVGAAASKGGSVPGVQAGWQGTRLAAAAAAATASDGARECMPACVAASPQARPQQPSHGLSHPLLCRVQVGPRHAALGAGQEHGPGQRSQRHADHAHDGHVVPGTPRPAWFGRCGGGFRSTLASSAFSVSVKRVCPSSMPTQARAAPSAAWLTGWVRAAAPHLAAQAPTCPLRGAGVAGDLVGSD